MGGRLVCEFAYIRQEENESYEVNSFPFGQTHVGFANLYFIDRVSRNSGGV